jgi:hypothetical protein
LSVISPDYWQFADFTYWFLDVDHQHAQHTDFMDRATAIRNGHSNAYSDLQVNRQQALDVWPSKKGDFVLLSDATEQAYEELHAVKSVYATLAFRQGQGDPEKIKDALAGYLANEVMYWGKPVLCKTLEQIKNPNPPFHFIGGGASFLRKGPRIVYTDLSAKRSEWQAGVQRLMQLTETTPI